MVSLESFVSKTLQLLDLEREAEIEETRVLQEILSLKELQRRGICLCKLRIANRAAGLYGRVVVTFKPFWHGKDLPSNSFSPGDIVGLSLSEAKQEELTSGIVTKVSQTAIIVAFDDSHDVFSLDDGVQYKLRKLANDVTYKRLKRALEDLNHYRSGPSSHLIDIFFNNAEPSEPFSQLPNKKSGGDGLDYINNRLDFAQRKAVRFALHQKEVAIIHGPPGTGKTTTIIEVILQSIKLKQKILACAPSNIAVDNLVERLIENKCKIVRIGHPARIVHSIQKYTLDALLSQSEASILVEDVRKDLSENMAKFKHAKKGDIHKLRQESKALRKELHEREKAATKEILRQADVVLATLTSSSPQGPLQHIEENHFDLIVIDECSQALEAACWIVLLYGSKCIMAGDHHQLPPTIISHEAAKSGLEVTLMERLIEKYGDRIVCLLTQQYRMNEKIMQWSSKTFYDNKLIADSSVSQHLLRDLPSIVDDENTSIPLLLIDTAGCGLFELNLADEVSKGNEGEADLVAFHVSKLVTTGVNPSDIAIITPYNLQVDLLRLRLSEKYPSLEIKSVDGFQGREQEAVVISLVRSNSQGEVGFLAEDRRLNVAITRARRHLAVICDSDTICHNSFLKGLIDYLNDNGEVRTAHEYINDDNFECNVSRPDYLQFKDSTGVSKKQVAKENRNSGAKIKTVRKSISKPSKEKMTNFQKTSDDEFSPSNIVKQISQFLADNNQQEFAFPNCLTSYQRKTVHEIVESLGLLHISHGEGDDRYVLVSKKKISSKEDILSINETPVNCIEDDNDLDKEVTTYRNKTPVNHKESDNDLGQKLTTCTSISKEKKQKKNLSKNPSEVISEIDIDDKHSIGNNCTFCKKNISQNLELHQIHCEKKQKLEKAAENVSKLTQVKTKKKRTLEDKIAEEDDFDTLIAIVTKENQTCHFSKCKTFTTLMGQKCEFCSKTYCLSHHIPEIHGCGEAARTRARKLIIKEGVLHRGSGVPDKKPDPTKRAHLQRKLDKKLSEMFQQRQPKKKDGQH